MNSEFAGITEKIYINKKKKIHPQGDQHIIMCEQVHFCVLMIDRLYALGRILHNKKNNQMEYT